MTIVAQSLRELAESIVYLTTNCNHSSYPTEFQAYNEAWEELQQSLDHLRPKLGECRYLQLIEMTAQAKEHYDAAYRVGFARRDPVRSDDPGLCDLKLGS